MNYELRPMRKTDLASVLDIETRSNLYQDEDFEVEAVRLLALTRRDLLSYLRQSAVGTHVLWTDNFIVGFLITQTRRYGMEVLHLVVDPEGRRQGGGSFALAEVRRWLPPRPAKRVIKAYVPDYDLPSCWFYKAKGFTSKLAREFYEDDADAIIFRREF